ncbi:MAG: potassium channel family protein, partial [Negativicutes bacterium]
WRTLLQFMCLSFLIIALFAVIYVAIINFDLMVYINKQQEFNNVAELISNMKQEDIDKLIHFSGLKMTDYSTDFHMYIDMFYFSAMTFFTVGFGDVTIKGALRILPVLESFIGVFFTSVFIALIIIQYQEEKADKRDNLTDWDLLKIYLHRGYDILDSSQEVAKQGKKDVCIYHITLGCVDKGEKNLTFIIDLNREKKYLRYIKKVIEQFRVNKDTVKDGDRVFAARVKRWDS